MLYNILIFLFKNVFYMIIFKKYKYFKCYIFKYINRNILNILLEIINSKKNNIIY